MLRLLHTADVHLGARHIQLADAGAAQRERQAAALGRAIEIAIAERVDAVLIAGDLFGAPVQARRTMERVGAELHRLVEARIPVVVLPGCSDPWDTASVYRAFDLASLAGTTPDSGLVTVLTPAQPWVHLQAAGALVGGVGPGYVVDRAVLPAATWTVAVAHAGVAAGADDDAPTLTDAEIAGSGVDYLALGHAHAFATGRAGTVTWAIPGPPELVDVTADDPGGVLLVTLDERAGTRHVDVDRRATGRTRFERRVVDLSGVTTRDALLDRIGGQADADVVLEVHLVGRRADALDVDTAALGDILRRDVLAARVLDRSTIGPWEGAMPAPQTVLGAYLRRLDAAIADLETRGPGDAEPGPADDGGDAPDGVAELRETLRLGRRLLAGQEVAL